MKNFFVLFMGLMILLSVGCVENNSPQAGDKTTTTVYKATSTTAEKAADMPNPASVYCEKQGGSLEIRTDSSGGQYGVCMLSDGRECEEWAYYRSEGKDCRQYVDPVEPKLIGGDKDEHGCYIAAGYSWCEAKQRCIRTWEEECVEEPASIANPASSYCEEVGGKSEIKTAEDKSQYGICRTKDGRECDEWIYFRSEGRECKPVTEYTVAEVLNISCLQSEECATPAEYLILSHCPYTSICINNSCAVVCPHPFSMPGKKESFCGKSTNADCKTDSDCIKGGCSGQICAGKDENVVTTCEYRDCYNAAAYNLSCRCVGGKCRWN